MIGRTLGRYRVIEEIGSGGVGVVYRAHDTRLERDVALKVLKPGALSDRSVRKRFRTEALALSKLNHPGVATVHDFDTRGEVDFLVMELIPGASLKEELAGGPLPEPEVLRLGVQLAEALAAAHAQGVVHQDLKPANLSITPERRLKILDFGLARLLPSAGGREASAGSTWISGTLPYMAPEQLRKEKVDARTDIHAAGAILYEMATGRRAFPEKGDPLIDAILNRTPTPPGQVQSLSAGLEALILKALDKDPGRRPQSAVELLDALRRVLEPAKAEQRAAVRPPKRWRLVAGGVLAAAFLAVGFVAIRGIRTHPTRGPIDSLAVLPLQNLSGDAEQEYFADGMTEALIADLAKVGSLRVISRTSAMTYKGTRKRLPQIARELDVDAVVEGSVLRSGGRVRITAQLIDAPTDRHLWADSYEGDIHDVLALQAEVARKIAQEVRAKLTLQEQARLAEVRRIDPETYQLYLKGRHHLNSGREASVMEAIGQFEGAIARDPTYAPAYSGLADAYLRLIDFGALADRSALPKAAAAARKAIEIDEGLAEAHTSLGHLAFHDWDWTKAEREYRRAIELKPGYAAAHQFLSSYLAAMGRTEEALARAREARRLDPLAPETMVGLAYQVYLARQYDQAIEVAKEMVAAEPDSPRGHLRLATVRLAMGMAKEAVPEFERFAALTPSKSRSLANLAMAYGRAGDRHRALAKLDELEALSREGHVPAMEIALAHIGLGERDGAFHWLEKAYDERSDWLAFLKVEPLFDPLRRDPRLADLARRVGLP